jgi:hypothetical protein
MKKKNFQELNFASGKDRKGKSSIYKKEVPTVKCVCGMRILVVPDLKAMNRAIKNHITEHKQMNYGLVPDSLEAFLTEQILIESNEMNIPDAS